MKEKLPGLFRPLMKFNVTAVMVIILMFSVFNVFSIVRTQQRQASLQTMALSQASQQIGDFIASAEQLGIVVQNDSQLMAYNLYNNRDLPHNIVWELEMLAPSVNSLSSLSIVYVDSLYPQINGVIYSSAGRFSYADYCRDELSGSLTENQLMEVVYAADHAHFVPQLSGNTRSLLYVMPIPSSYVFSPGRLLLRLDYTSFTRGLRATAAGNSDIYVFDSEENLLLYFGPTYGNDITAARAAQSGLKAFPARPYFATSWRITVSRWCRPWISGNIISLRSQLFSALCCWQLSSRCRASAFLMCWHKIPPARFPYWYSAPPSWAA